MIFSEIIALLIGVLLIIFSIMGTISGISIPKINSLSLLVPKWNFFAPNPATQRYHLLYRLGDHESNLSCWKEINLNKRSWYTFVYNPSKRLSKGFFDIIIDMSSKPISDISNLNISYLLILNLVNDKVQNSFNTTYYQYMIMVKDFPDDAKPRVLFLSNIHKK